ncbi:HNH endonuclease [Gordonia sp. PP30]|uniref:HNH endonuclease signature motif containing protein n=1 Tax=Gordonia sp. PP30 TaxID=2935861 RepID=UPI001FFF8E46|nr:HNH endonuclease signature motif containing protein [Gordonia sp. PP30]UQE76724.1 HNH endonuclease [Gordonia sp. PP30]
MTIAMSDEFASRWALVDFGPAGMAAADEAEDAKSQCHSWMVYAEAAWRGQAYLYSRQLFAIGQFLDLELATLDDRVCAGTEQKDLLDPYAVAVDYVAIAFAGTQRAARALVAMAVAASERLPKTADLLRRTVISPEMFEKVVDRTDIIDDHEIVAQVDDDLADTLARAGHISEKAAERIADRIVDKRDADANKKRREKAQRRKNVTNRDYPGGLGGINITADAEESRLAYEAVEVMIAGVCPNDPRTRGALRSAAAIARLRKLPFTCACTDKETCTASQGEEEISERQARIIVRAVCQKSTLAGADDDPGFLDGHGPISASHVRDLAQRPDALVRDLDLDKLLTPRMTLKPCTALAPEPASADRDGDSGGGDGPARHDADEQAAALTARTAFRHVSANASTAQRAEGHVSTAQRAEGHVSMGQRAEGRVSTGQRAEGPVPPVFLTGTAQRSDPYRPTEALDVLVRALFGTCTVPGCNRPAWNCELDHCEEFDHVCPASGGPTCLCNLNPKCKRHHLLKTHLGASNPADGWVDEQWIDDDGTVWTAITVHGMTFETRAANQWLFPQLAGVRCAHQAQAPPEPAPPGPAGADGTGGCRTGGGLRVVTEYKHAWRRALRLRSGTTERARLRRIRERAAEAGGPPPF